MRFGLLLTLETFISHEKLFFVDTERDTLFVIISFYCKYKNAAKVVKKARLTLIFSEKKTRNTKNIVLF